MAHSLKLIFVALIALGIGFCLAAPVFLAAGWPMAFTYVAGGVCAGAASVRMHQRRKTEQALLRQS